MLKIIVALLGEILIVCVKTPLSFILTHNKLLHLQTKARRLEKEIFYDHFKICYDSASLLKKEMLFIKTAYQN